MINGEISNIPAPGCAVSLGTFITSFSTVGWWAKWVKGEKPEPQYCPLAIMTLRHLGDLGVNTHLIVMDGQELQLAERVLEDGFFQAVHLYGDWQHYYNFLVPTLDIRQLMWAGVGGPEEPRHRLVRYVKPSDWSSLYNRMEQVA